MAEREKRRATTFVTSRGAIINVAAPSVYIAPGVTPVDVTNPAEMREALREELRDEWLGAEVYLERDLDRVFNGRITDVAAGVVLRINVDDYWGINQSPVTPLTLPAGYNYLSIYSRRVFKCGYLSVMCILPAKPAAATYVSCFMGFEAQGATRLGAAAFNYAYGKLFVFIGGGVEAQCWDISSKLPADALTAYHVYTVKVDRDTYWFFIDGQIVAIVPVNQPGNTSLMGPPPYGVVGMGASQFSPSIMPTLLELNCDAPPVSWNISQYIATEGEEKPARRLDLNQYESASLLCGAVIAAGSLTSHPFPVFGYAGKTIRFRANQSSTAGGLVIQELLRSGNWRTYEAQTYVANADWIYPVGGDGVLMRLLYTPAAYPATVAEGEVVLR